MTGTYGDPSGSARVARSEVRIRTSQVRRGGVAKLTDIVAALVDAAFDDLVAVNGGWMPGRALVVRAHVIDHRVPARLGEVLQVEVTCAGLARHWLEHRTTALGDLGADVEVSTSWVVLDTVTGRPAALPEAVLDGYSTSAHRRPRPVPRLAGPPADAERRPWLVRADDLDGNEHVNNAACLSVVAEVLERRPVAVPHRVEVTYRTEVTWPSELEVAHAAGADAVDVWLIGAAGVHAAMRITSLHDGIAVGAERIDSG